MSLLKTDPFGGIPEIAGAPITERSPGGGTQNGATDRSAHDGIRFRRPPQLRRRRVLCPGMVVEAIAITPRERFESGYCGPLHLLIAHEKLSRRRGVTSIEGLPASRQENLVQTLTFVPPGFRFREWHDPDSPAQITYVHIDPSATAQAAGRDVVCHQLLPRLHFHNPLLWETVRKVRTLLNPDRACSPRYGAALGLVLVHELMDNEQDLGGQSAPDRGGLAAWQRRLVARHVEEHLAEHLPISSLAKLARLSRFHFSRSFRHSFGLSPHRYHLHRRVERAKTLLANPAWSITDIALELGFRESSTFSTAFRRVVGRTPTDYRRLRLLGEDNACE